MEDILSSMETAFTSGAADAKSAIAKGVAAGIPLMLIMLGVRLGVRAFKSAAK